MRDFFFNLFKKLFAKEFSSMESELLQKVTNKVRQTDIESKRCIETIEANMLVSHPVIYFSNEYDNVVVGFVKSVVTVTKADCPMLLVHDYVRNDEVVVHHRWPTLQMFSEQVLNSFCAIDRNALLTFLYGRYRDSSLPEMDYRKKPETGFLTLPQLIGRLQHNGFYEKLREYRAQTKTKKAKALQEH